MSDIRKIRFTSAQNMELFSSKVSCNPRIAKFIDDATERYGYCLADIESGYVLSLLSPCYTLELTPRMLGFDRERTTPIITRYEIEHYFFVSDYDATDSFDQIEDKLTDDEDEMYTRFEDAYLALTSTHTGIPRNVQDLIAWHKARKVDIEIERRVVQINKLNAEIHELRANRT